MEPINVRRLYAAVLSGIILYLILDIVAQLLPPHYNPISQAESDLAVGSFGYIMTINFLNRGILSIIFLFAFLGSIRLSGDKVAKYRSGLFLWSLVNCRGASRNLRYGCSFHTNLMARSNSLCGCFVRIPCRCIRCACVIS